MDSPKINFSVNLQKLDKSLSDDSLDLSNLLIVVDGHHHHHKFSTISIESLNCLYMKLEDYRSQIIELTVTLSNFKPSKETIFSLFEHPYSTAGEVSTSSKISSSRQVDNFLFNSFEFICEMNKEYLKMEGMAEDNPKVPQSLISTEQLAAFEQEMNSLMELKRQIKIEKQKYYRKSQELEKTFKIFKEEKESLINIAKVNQEKLRSLENQVKINKSRNFDDKNMNFNEKNKTLKKNQGLLYENGLSTLRIKVPETAANEKFSYFRSFNKFCEMINERLKEKTPQEIVFSILEDLKSQVHQITGTNKCKETELAELELTLKSRLKSLKEYETNRQFENLMVFQEISSELSQLKSLKQDKNLIANYLKDCKFALSKKESADLLIHTFKFFKSEALQLIELYEQSYFRLQSENKKMSENLAMIKLLEGFPSLN